MVHLQVLDAVVSHLKEYESQYYLEVFFSNSCPLLFRLVDNTTNDTESTEVYLNKLALSIGRSMSSL